MGVLSTNAAPSKRAMGMLHDLALSCTSAVLCIELFILGNTYSLSVKIGMISLVWWVMVVITVIEIIVVS
jgi:hypothetical protein